MHARIASGSVPSIDDGQSLAPLADLGRLLLDRRVFLGGAAAGSLGFLAEDSAHARGLGLKERIFCCASNDPLGCVRRRWFDVLVAFTHAQLVSLWGGPPAESAVAVANDLLRYAEHLDTVYQQGICGSLTLISIYARQQTGRKFARLSVRERMKLLNQGEYQASGWYRPGERLYPLIRWEVDFPMHAVVAGLSMLTRLVTFSRRVARTHVNLVWSDVCKSPERLVHVPPPPYPDLSAEYDVCIVGTGAGGAVMAARAALAGKRVLMIEKGTWVSPDEVTERYPGPDGKPQTYPARGDVVLAKLYHKAGVDMTGSLRRFKENHFQLLFQRKRQRIRPKQSVNLVKASVVGGGPYVNNAIHLAMREETWSRWGNMRPTGVSYADFRARMDEINESLGVNRQASLDRAGARSLVFAHGAAAGDIGAEPVPVSITRDCAGCGSDNSVDPFGSHVGGVHPYRPGGPNSFLMRALGGSNPARIAYEMKAVRFECERDEAGRLVSRCLVVEDRRGRRSNCRGPHLRIRAKQFVLAAGAVASTNILYNTARHNGLAIRGLGERFNGNVGTAVYGVYDKPIVDGVGSVPEPGITQVFFVERRRATGADGTVLEEPALENWFHFPGTVAVALAGWFSEYAKVMNKYNQISMAGMVVPTKVRAENCIRADGETDLNLDAEEFDLLLAGMRRIARIFLAAAAADNGVAIHLPTKGLLLDSCGRPRVIRSEADLEAALAEIRRRGPAFVNLICTHLQGGNSLGLVTSRDTFRVVTQGDGEIENLYVADSSIFPAGCEINPQLTVKTLAMYAADAMLGASTRVPAQPTLAER